MMIEFRPFFWTAQGTLASVAAVLFLGATGAGAQTSDSQRKTMIFGVVPADPRPVDPLAAQSAAANTGPMGAASPADATASPVPGQQTVPAPPQIQGPQDQTQAALSGPQPQAVPGQPQPVSQQADASGSSLSAVQVGLLECRGEFATGYGFGSSRKVTCVFQPSAGEVHYYVGTLDRVGLDIGISDQASMLWAVLATSRTLQPGALAGRYVGLSSGFALGPGFSANMLASSDASRQITLQPLSVSSDSGLSLSITGATLTLTPSATRPR